MVLNTETSWSPTTTFYHRICLTINKIVYHQHLLVSFEELLSLRLSDHFALVVGCINNNWLINGKWLKTAFKKCPRTSISCGKARDKICAFKFAPSRHAIWFAYIVRLTRALCRSLVVEGSVVRSWFLSNCSTRVPLAAPGITRSPSKRICCGRISQKTRNWPIWQAADGYGTYFVTSISARNTGTWAFFFPMPFSTTFRRRIALKPTGID